MSGMAHGGVLVVGAGGLGCPALLHLAAAGVSRLGVAEFDTVEASNLPRQLIYGERDLGRLKLDVIEERLAALPGRASFTFVRHDGIVRGDEDWLGAYAVVVDAVDTAAQKFAIHDLVVARGIPLVHAGASGWEAEVLTVRQPGCLRCLFGEGGGEGADCRRAGILGPVVGLAGIKAAGEALRLSSGGAGRYERRLWTFDARSGRERVIEIVPDPCCSICGRQH